MGRSILSSRFQLFDAFTKPPVLGFQLLHGFSQSRSSALFADNSLLEDPSVLDSRVIAALRPPKLFFGLPGRLGESPMAMDGILTLDFEEKPTSRHVPGA